MSDDITYLSRLKICDFRTFGDLTLDLPEEPGLTVIHGPNGLGKSSLFDAIEWALSGRVERLMQAKASPVERERAIKRAGVKRPRTSVALEFTDSLRLERKLVGGLKGDPNCLVQPDWPAPKALATYLQFTHFLGQTAGQRFINKEDKERLEAIVGPARLDEIQQLGEKLLRLKKSALRPLKLEAGQALRLAETRLERWLAVMAERVDYAVLAQAGRALAPTAVKAESASIAVALAKEFGAVQKDLSGAEADEALALVGAMVAERMAAWQDWLRTIDAAEQTIALWEAARARRESLHAERIQTEAAGNALAERIAHLMQGEADLRAKQDARRRPAQAVEERLGRLRNLNEWVTYEASVEGQLAQLHPALQAAEQNREALRAAVQQAEARRNAGEEAAARWRAAMNRRDRVKALEERARRFAQQQAQRAERERACQAVEPNLLVVAQREVELAEQVGRHQHELSDARARLQVMREHSDAMQQAVAIIAARLDTEDVCPVCGAQHESAPILKKKAETQAHKHHAPLAELEARANRLQTELDALNQQLVHARTDRIRYEAERAVLETSRQLEEGAWAELAAEPELAGQQREDAAAWVASLVYGAEVVIQDATAALSAAGEFASLTAAADAAHAHLADAERQISQLAQQHAGIEANIRTANETIASIVVHLDLGTDWRSGLDAQIREKADTLTALKFDISAFDLQLAELTSQLAAEQTAAAQLRARQVALHEGVGAAEAELAHLAEAWRNAGLEAPIGSEERTRKLGHARRQLAALEAMISRHEQAVAGMRVWKGQTELRRAEDELAQARADVGLEDDVQVEAKFRGDLAAAKGRLSKLEVFERHAEAGYHKSKDIGELIQTKTMTPLNKILSRFSTALMPEDHQVSVDCRFGYGQGASVKAHKFGSDVNPELYLSEGQLAALNIAVLMSASVTYPWSRWRALLMDDPLHHNDVIHASAFMDVICNLIGDRKYQVILSTHDGTEAEYFLRKAKSAGLPARSCSLLNLSANGVKCQID